jgi:DNA polymerase bacteriophage-type
MILSIDFETASRADLRKTGAYAYSKDPSTRVLCMAWAFDDQPVRVWKPGDHFPIEIIDHVARLRTVQGWNIGFEFVIWNNVLRRLLPHLPELELSQLRDTMAAAAYWGLPLKLDDAAKAARVGQLKDEQGHALMLRMARPRAEAGGVVTWWHETDPDKYLRLMSYCAQDVEAERAVGRAVGRVPDIEQRIWQLDQRMNMRGVGIDLDLVNRLRDIAQRTSLSANDLLHQLTGGEVGRVTNAKGLLAYLKDRTAYGYDDLRKGTVEARLLDPACVGHEREVLELRADTAKTSAAKLQSMVLASDAAYSNQVPRVRGMLQYYGAIRTGRWAGRLIQLQNLPRGSVKFITEAIQAILDGVQLPILEALFGPAMGIVSSALRGCIIAAEGHDLVVADFSQIEARVLPWLAGQQDILDVFASGEDVYVYTAKGIGSDSRQLGKVLVLACGFGMSAEKFQATAAAAPYFVHLTLEEAERAVGAWRQSNRFIVSLWRRYENAARAVVTAWEQSGHGAGPVRRAGAFRDAPRRPPNDPAAVRARVGLPGRPHSGRPVRPGRLLHGPEPVHPAMGADLDLWRQARRERHPGRGPRPDGARPDRGGRRRAGPAVAGP